MEGGNEVDLPNNALSPSQVVSASTAEPVTRTITEDDGDYCRICRGEGTTTQPLFYPCKCSGSIKFVHQDCLMEWLSHSQKKYCELCKTPFRFTKLYDRSMPSTLPLPVFLQQIALHSVRAVSAWTRYLLVAFVWLCWLPWSIRQVWRGLFWLADGSWITEKNLRDYAVTEFRTVLETNTSIAVNTLSEPQDATTTARAIPQALAHISGLFGLSSDEYFLVQIIRNLYPNIFRWSLSLISAKLNEDSLLMSIERQPSLLSEVQFLKALTGYPLLDNALTDVFEGQLVCLMIITVFILVFLIREWVINQQPILNMPDPDRADNALPPVQPIGVAHVGRRRHGIRRGQGLGLQAPDAAPRDPPRPIPDLHPRRDVTENDVLHPDLPEVLDGSGSVIPMRSASDTPHSEGVDKSNGGTTSVESTHITDVETSNETRPPLLLRGALDDAANIHRNIEESSNPPGRRQDLEGIIVPRETLDPLGEESTSSEVEHGRHSDLESISSPLEDSQSMRGISNTTSSATAATRDADQRDSSTGPASSSNQEAGMVTQDPADTVESNHEANVTAEDSELAGSHPSDVGDDLPLDKQSIFEPLIAWFWHTDEYVPQLTDTPMADDEQVVDDLAEENPFVPAQPAIVNAQHDLVDDDVLFPDLQLDAEVNAEAVEDAEDLDGILELIGVRGPIAGMIQNVIFSEFLITLTIAASVWLPYIWGKIALLVLANPVGVFVRAPLYLVARTADLVLDLFLFVSGLMGYGIGLVGYVIKLTLRPIIPGLSKSMGVSILEGLSWDLARSSGFRLEKAVARTVTGLKPDLPTFSMQSHHALRVFKARTSSLLVSVVQINPGHLQSCVKSKISSIDIPSFDAHQTLRNLHSTPRKVAELISALWTSVRTIPFDLRPLSISKGNAADFTLVRWSTQDKVVAIVLGYLFFAILGILYLKTIRTLQGLRAEEKVEGIFPDSLRQAGGVMKVVLIIGIEMIIFPLYCGLLLDVALLPLFNGATVTTRIEFMVRAPITGIFVHWFIGTCYMFHFALFVSMCRKIMRKGVLYFIRDPDDPTFHPVRDVLERPVATQLGKIAFSAVIYGGLVILCLGGVVWGINGLGGVFPIQWSTNEPRLAFPIDILFYNFLLPFILRKAEPSKHISSMYEWWFRGCASSLRLTHFLFGEEKEEEKGSHVRRTWRALFQRKSGDVQKPVIGEDRRTLAEDREVDAYFYHNGGYVRAPANDSVRIPRGAKVFIEVDENNERVDGKADQDRGIHGKMDDRFTKVYVPPNFRSRIATFIFLLWTFAAATGMAFTLGPLIVGRRIIQATTQSRVPPNDLYALTVGVHVCGSIVYAVAYRKACFQWLTSNALHHFRHARQALPHVYSGVKHAFELLYLAATFGVILPFAMSFLMELYIDVPFYTYLSSASRGSTSPAKTAVAGSHDWRPLTPTIYIFQAWVVGLLYFRLALRLARNHPNRHTRAAHAIAAITRDGWTRPNVRLATRAVVLPTITLCITLAFVPIIVAKAIILVVRVEDAEARANVYRFSYPGLLAACLTLYLAVLMKRKIGIWRIKIRDEVYLIGERLHNFQEVQRSQPAGSSRGTQRAASARVDVAA